jgi:hypothetical protein
MARIIKPEHVARGADAEEFFQTWLDQSRLPYIYATQTRASVPTHFRKALKRPDYLVALPFVGTIAFDVKSKTVYGDAFIFDVREVRGLATFGELFNIPTFFACLDPAGEPDAVWFRVASIDLQPLKEVGRRKAFVASVAEGLRVDMRRPFQEALRDAISLA